MIAVFFILGTLACAAAWYFLCGMQETDTDNHSNIGCVTSLVIGFIFTLIMVIIYSLGGVMKGH